MIILLVIIAAFALVICANISVNIKHGVNKRRRAAQLQQTQAEPEPDRGLKIPRRVTDRPVTVISGVWHKEFPAYLTIGEIKHSICALTSDSPDDYIAYAGMQKLDDKYTVMGGSLIQMVRKTSLASAWNNSVQFYGTATRGFSYGTNHKTMHDDVVVEEPEVANLYAWKIFDLIRVAESPGSVAKLVLAPLVRKSFQYNVLGENWYNQDIAISNSEKTRAKLLHPIFDIQHPDLGSRGFYSFNSPTFAMQENTNDQWMKFGVIGKIRIWGDIVEAERGYRSEYFEIVDLYFRNNSSSPLIERICDEIGWPFPGKRMRELEL